MISLGRYLSGLCVAALGLCAAGWLVLTPVAFGYRGSGLHGSGLHGSGLHGSGLHRAAVADRATGGGLAVVCVLTLVAWGVAWRRKLRADGVLASTSRRQARREARERRWAELRQREAEGESDPVSSTPDPAQVLSELRALLLPLLAEQADGAPAAEPADAPAAGPAETHQHAGIPEPRSEQEPFGTLDGFQPAPNPGGIAAIESMLADADLLTVGSGEEEAW